VGRGLSRCRFTTSDVGYVHVNEYPNSNVIYGKYRVYLIPCVNRAIENCASTFFNKPRQQVRCVHMNYIKYLSILIET
jgi:hypothetical protein